MSSLNRVIIMGRLGQDPELRYTQNQTAVATLNIATTEFRGGRDGTARQEFTEWHRVIVWNKQAENCSKYLSKGRGVLVEGRLQTRSWEDQQGQKKFTTEVIASNVQFLSAGGQNQGNQYERQEYQGNSGSASPGAAPQLPQVDANSQGASSSFNMGSANLDEIPF